MAYSDEERILGIVEDKKKTPAEENAFTKEFKYLINDKDIIGGDVIGNILAPAVKREFLNGVKELNYKNMKIKKIGFAETGTEVKPKAKSKPKAKVEE